MKLRGEKDAHWHLLIKITIKIRVFMPHPKASVNIATRESDKPNHTLARYDIFYQRCFMKNIVKEIFKCDQSINTD